MENMLTLETAWETHAALKAAEPSMRVAVAQFERPPYIEASLTDSAAGVVTARKILAPLTAEEAAEVAREMRAEIKRRAKTARMVRRVGREQDRS